MNIESAFIRQLQTAGAVRILSESSKRSSSYTDIMTGYTNQETSSYHVGFGSVTLLEEDVTAYYGTDIITGSNSGSQTAGCKKESDWEEIDSESVNAVTLPESFDSLKDNSVYYHGKLCSEYELVQTAVASGKLTLTEDMKGFEAAKNAFQVMVIDQSDIKYGWSTTKYSEDGKYTFTLKEDGSYEQHLVEDSAMGASLDEIANWIASGVPNRNIETRYLNYLQRIDPDLYNAAQNIGKEVCTYQLMTAAYDAGTISYMQHDYDLSLLAMLFNRKDVEDFYAEFNACTKTKDYRSLLDQYSPSMAEYLSDLRIKQVSKTGGII